MVITRVVDDLDSNARNWPGYILIKRGIKHSAAVWAQEFYEAQLKLNPVNTLKVVFSSDFRRDMEIMGHEIEVQAAVAIYDVNEEVYRSKEARDLTRYDEFRDKKMTREQVYALMENVRLEARKFVKQNMKEIRQHDYPAG